MYLINLFPMSQVIESKVKDIQSSYTSSPDDAIRVSVLVCCHPFKLLELQVIGSLYSKI